MEHFSEVEPFVVHLEMMENTCPHNDLSPSYVMNIPLEKRSISYVWTKHPSRAGDYTAGVYKGSREGAYSLIISPFHRFLWGQLGFDSLGLDREIILRPSRVQSREEIRVHSLSFQADMRNRQFLTSNSTQQFVFQAVGVQLVLDDDGNYRLTETESFGVGRHFNILSVLSSISSVEFVFEDDSSFCEAVFSAIPSRWQGLVFPRDTRFIDVRYLPPSFKEEMTPAVVDKDRDPHQRFYSRFFEALYLGYRW